MSRLGHRLRALIVLLWRAGLRINEALSLHEGDLDRSRGAVLVRRGKGGTELRASGQTARRRGPSTRDELTAQELQIATLVTQGLANREVAAQMFLGPRTVDFHLRSVFRKLDISSRTQLATLDLESASNTSPQEIPAI